MISSTNHYPRTLVLALILLLASVAFFGRVAHAGTDSGDRGIRLSLDANVGWGGYFGTHGFLASSDETLLSSSPIYSGALSITWRVGSARAGVRGYGFYGKMQGEGESEVFTLGGGSGSITTDLSATLVGGYIGVVAEHSGVWASTGAGVLYLHSVNGGGGPYRGTEESDHTYFAPDLCLAFGYNLYLARFVALRVSVEAGMFPFWAIHYRGSINAGVLVRI
jgi:hypothetical protein